MAQNLRTISEIDFIKGYNDRDKPENLYSPKGSYMADIKNWFCEENKLIKRNGYSVIGNAPVEAIILGQNRHEPSGGSKYILRARNDEDEDYSVVESWSGSGNWATLTNATTQTVDALHEFVMAENATYIFTDQGDTVLKTSNGTTASTVAAIPKGYRGMWWHNFLFVWGVSGNRSRLYFSDINEPETFDAINGYIDINKDDGEEIVACDAIGDELIIMKTSRTFVLTGYGTADFTLNDLGDFGTGVGTLSARGLVPTGKDLLYIYYIGQVPHFKSIQRTRFGSLYDEGVISDAITGTMKRLITTRISQTAGIYDGRRVWWSVVTSGTTNNEIVVYDTQTGGWVRFTGINASCFHISTITGEPQLYFGSSTASGKSYVLDTSTSDDGEAIDAVIKTPAYPSDPGRQGRFKYFYLTADVESDVDIDVDYSPDGFTFNDLDTISLTGTGAAFGTAIFGTSRFGATTIARDRLDWAGGNAYYMQYQLSNNAADEEVAIREWEVMYKPRNLRSA